MTKTVADAAAELQAIAGKDPEDPATDSAPATVPNYMAALSRPRSRQADRRHQQHQRQLPGGDRGDPGARRDHGPDPDADPGPDFPASSLGVQARPQRLSRPPARERADEVAADIIAFNTAHADEALKFGQTLLTRARRST